MNCSPYPRLRTHPRITRLGQGAASPQPVDGITGYECPRGSYCPAGSAYPIGCPPGTYNPSEAMGECAECLAGSVCPGNSTTPEECPLYHYCPAASASGILCPGGTYGARVSWGAPYSSKRIDCIPCETLFFVVCVKPRAHARGLTIS